LRVRLRPPVAGDARAVLEAITARDLADLSVPDFTLEDLLDEWRVLGDDLAQDAAVVEAQDGRIAAYAAVLRHGSYALVAPQYEGQGIGTEVLRWTEARERKRGNQQHRQWIAERNLTAHSLLQRAGYEHARSVWRMVGDLRKRAPSTPTPDGIVIRAVELPDDAHSLHALDAVSFVANPDYAPEPFEEFYAKHLAAHDFDPAASLLAEHTGEVVGFALSRRWDAEGVGYIAVLGVHPEHRRRGIASALLSSALARFAAEGLREAQLGVASDNPRAIRLYERAGMHPRFRFDVYERPMSGDPETSGN
jgi:mycothiol synthase